MKFLSLPFTVIDWNTVPAVEHEGESGAAICRRFQSSNLRVRQIEYTPGYRAEDWCDRRQVLYVLEGELEAELKDGQRVLLKPGMSVQVSGCGGAAYRSSTITGAKLFIVD
ncbi:MAG: hypothetical protein FD175_1475 [Beijerinckiaceae bacterium]|nr:MAG: hypothetical protein FD175_1475 [Beijerinckiaceae bacterium]